MFKNLTIYNFITLVTFLIIFFIGVNNFADYGITWDESSTRFHGLVSLKYITDHFPEIYDFTSWDLPENPKLHKYDYKAYGVSFELILTFFEKVSSLKTSREIFLLRHFLNYCLYFFGLFLYRQILL